MTPTTSQSPRTVSRTSTRPSSFPRSTNGGPNLATLDQLRGLRHPRLVAPEARRHQLPSDCSTC